MVSASSLRSTSSLILGGYREKQFNSCPNFVINFARNFHQFRILGQVYPTYTVILLWDQNLQAPPSTKYVVAVVQSLSHIELSVTPWATACQVSLSSTTSQRYLFGRCLILFKSQIIRRLFIKLIVKYHMLFFRENYFNITQFD